MAASKKTSTQTTADPDLTENDLSEKDLMFVDNYLRTWNATIAYQSVHPKASYATARANGCLKLAKTNIQAEILRRLKQLSMETDEVLARLTDFARGSHRPFVKVSDNGAIYFDFSNPEAMEHLHLIKKIKTKRTRRVEGKGDDAEQWEDEWVEVEVHDPQKALELLGKAHKMFTVKHEVTGKDGAPLVPAAIDIKALSPYLSDEDLETLDKATEIIERAQRDLAAAVEAGS